jgi:hypothetical protein
LNEAETRAELIDPALHAAGWGVMAESRTRREVIAPGRIMGGGKRGREKSADYVLVYRNIKLGVIEAKAAGKSYTEGVVPAPERRRSRSRSPGSCFTRGGTWATGSPALSLLDARASCSSPIATSWQTRPITASAPSPRMRWCGSTPS